MFNILLRSFNLHSQAIPESLKAVGRAGAGLGRLERLRSIDGVLSTRVIYPHDII
jgi:hypothetical protein